MRIWSDARGEWLHGRGVGGLGEIHGEAGRGLVFCGFGGLGIFQFLAAVTAGHFTQAFGCGIFLDVD